jgi:hypothetical protein
MELDFSSTPLNPKNITQTIHTQKVDNDEINTFPNMNIRKIKNKKKAPSPENYKIFKIIKAIYKKNRIDNIMIYYREILSKLVSHNNRLYEERYIFRHHFNTISTQIKEIIKETYKKEYSIKYIIEGIQKIIYLIGMSNVKEILEYLGIYKESIIKDNHMKWMNELCVPILITSENGSIDNIHFRPTALIGLNSIENNRGIWASIPYKKNKHIAIKLIVGKDIIGTLKECFRGKIRLIGDGLEKYVGLLTEKQLITETSTEIRNRINIYYKNRIRIGKSPGNKIIKEFLNADLTKQISMMAAMMMPGNIDKIETPTPLQNSPKVDCYSDKPSAGGSTAPVDASNANRLGAIGLTPDRPRVGGEKGEPGFPDGWRRGTEGSEPESPKEPESFISVKTGDGCLSHLLTILYDIYANHSLLNRRDIPDLIDLLPWEIQIHIRELRNNRAESIMRPDEDEIPDEARVQLIKADPTTIKIALQRLKEAKTKNNGDGAAKAATWISGLLKIPFGIYRKEPLLSLRDNTLEEIKNILGEDSKDIECITDLYSFILSRYSSYIGYNTEKSYLYWKKEHILNILTQIKNIKILKEIANKIIQGFGEEDKYYGKNIAKRTNIIEFILSKIDKCSIVEFYEIILHLNEKNLWCDISGKIISVILLWEKHSKILSNGIINIKKILDSCIHQQQGAKEQIMRIMGQWMVGENTGYCLGFEGPPGVGKTTLAREGISNILKDESGKSRPFHMIALGTATTGTSLIGHNYTYHGSTWGDIARFLMDSQCMNPIIYIDELDKVSTTENGKEIIGILTHLTDPAQNEEFQDRYFAGIKLDMSKILFIFSYNDADKIDPILLDRIHRIRFDSLTLNEKIHITKYYTIPEISKKLKLPIEITRLDDNTIKHIIWNYTNEAGIRKLREIIYDTFREVNLQEIRGEGEGGEVIKNLCPSIKFIEDNILRYRTKPHRLIADNGVWSDRIYGMFATSSGLGGILPIRVIKDYGCKEPKNYPIITTGRLGDIMKESISVARMVVLDLLLNRNLHEIPPSRQSVSNREEFKDGMGIHLHFPEGATPKDGPSAGLAICILLWSYYTKTPIGGHIALTGEIDLNGNVLAIGGLQEKLIGAKIDGIKYAIIPKENQRELDIIYDKISKEEIPEKIILVEDLKEAIEEIIKEMRLIYVKPFDFIGNEDDDNYVESIISSP